MTPIRETRKAGRTAGSNARYAASLTASLCLALTLFINVAPRLDPTIGSRRLHVGLETAAGMVLIFIAAVLLGRFRLFGSRRTLLKLAAVLVLVLDNLSSAVLSIVLDSPEIGGFSTWTFAGHGLLGALLLAVAAVLPDHPVTRRGHAMLLVVGSSVALFVAVTALTVVFRDQLPGVFDEAGDPSELEVFGEHPALAVVEGLTAACYAVAAIAFARLAEEHEDEFLKWLAIGSVIASVAYVNYTLFPSQFTELLYSGDLFFLAAVAALLFGAVREISREEAAMIRTAVLEERRRVARDLHDGVAQELAFIASQTQWLLRQPDDLQPLNQIMDSVERALDESRGAIAALSRPMDEPIDLAVGQAALDVANRVGARLNLDLDQRVEVPVDWRDALLRITREAVGNAVRHGRARTVTIQLREADGVWLRVIDDGEGFDVAAPRSRQSYGLTSMRERTESLGGRFTIESSPGSGTTVAVQLP